MELPESLKIKVPEGFEDMFKKISDPSVFKKDFWYKMPKDKKTLDFLEWMRVQLMRVEYSECGNYFMVNFQPVFAGRQKTVDIQPHQTTSSLAPKLQPLKYKENKTIPGFCARPDIVNRLIDEYNKENNLK